MVRWMWSWHGVSAGSAGERGEDAAVHDGSTGGGGTSHGCCGGGEGAACFRGGIKDA